MATDTEKQQLIDMLKFTPVTYRAEIWGWGGEIAIGRGRLKGISATVTWKIPDEKPLAWTIEQKVDKTLDIKGSERDILEKCVSEKLQAELLGQEMAHGA